MKSSSTHSTVLLAVVCLAILGYSERGWADWTPLDRTEDADVSYDREDIKRSPSGIATVWTKHVFTKKGVGDRVSLLGAAFEKVDHSINLVELDCVGKMALFLSTVYFSRNGGVLDIKESGKEWEFIETGSMFDTLYHQVCP